MAGAARVLHQLCRDQQIEEAGALTPDERGAKCGYLFRRSTRYAEIVQTRKDAILLSNRNPTPVATAITKTRAV